MTADSDFLRELRATFMVEAREHAQVLSRGLLSLEQQADAPPERRADALESVFRAAHSLKGAARAVELREIESVCQSMEDVFAALRRGKVEPTAVLLDVLHRALDTLGLMLDALDATGAATLPPDLAALRRQLRQLVPAAGHAAAATVRMAPAAAWTPQAPALPAAMQPPSSVRAQAELPPPAASAVAPPEDTVRVSLSSLEQQLLGAEELLVSKLVTRERANAMREVSEWFAQWRRAWIAMERNTGVLRQDVSPEVRRLHDFCEWSNDAVRALEGRIMDLRRGTQRDRETIGKLADQLLEGAKDLLLVPFSSISAPLPRMVRDLARAQGKEVDLLVDGEQTQVDKHILEEMKDTLVQMLRNAVDHAVELPAARVAAGKPARASVRLSIARREGRRVCIELSDDGRGIDVQAVRRAALERGVITPEHAAALDDEGALALVFRSDVSTGTAATPLSGRGLGLAIAHEHVRRLEGQLRVRSKPGAGTRFEIDLPAVRATFRGILCEAANQVFMLPVHAVGRVGRVRPDAIEPVEGRPTLSLNGQTVALVPLADVLELPSPARPHGSQQQYLLVHSGDRAIAFAVDAVLEEQEVLLKPLRPPLVRVRNVAAAAMLGSGRVVPILNVADLFRSAQHVTPVVPQAPLAKVPARRSVLVAEDSITSRMLLKTILESAGYQVTTAADGMEAFALLRSASFDLLVSDVEMPRLNGFDLTARIRADRRLAELPVVLVTALARPEDRERGIDVGADAYIVKGSFDQNSLVENVQRLI